MDFKILVNSLEELEKYPSRLKKTKIISELLKKTDEDNLKSVIYLLQGRIFPHWDEREIGISSQLAIKAITASTGIEKDKIVNLWKSKGDLGEVMEELISKSRQASLFKKKLSIEKVFENLQKLASLEGKGSVKNKIDLITELLNSADVKEARYIIKIVIGNLRVGVAEGTLRDSIVWAFLHDVKEEIEDREEYNKKINLIQESYDITNDYGEVAMLAKKNKLKSIELDIGKPLNPMLYPKVGDMDEAFKTVGKPAAFEYKYDGMRLQINKKKGEIKLFTRRLDNVAKQFPEVVKNIKECVKGDNYILDTEAVGFTKGGYVPFQKISQRIKRKYGIEEMAKKFPVEINVFDIIAYNNKAVLNKPFKERRKLLEGMVKEKKKKVILAKQIITENKEKAERFFNEALKEGQEGVMVKNLEGIYKPGRRVGYGVKLKTVMENLDLVITGGEWGAGKRAKWLSSFILSCRKENKFLEIGKVGTGIKEKSEGVTYKALTKMLKSLIIKEEGRKVEIKAKVIIEVAYEEIQKSPTYNSGYALRFPRLIRLREDKKVNDVDTLERVERLYGEQKK